MFTEYTKLSKKAFRVSENPVDFIQPTLFQVWHKFIDPQPLLRNWIGIEEFSWELHKIGAIEIFQFGRFKNGLRCKILDESKISAYVQNRIQNPSMNYGIKRFITGFFFLSVIVLFSISSFAADKKYTATISKCEDKLILASCEKVKVWCDEGDGRACRALAGYWAQKKDFETANSFINLGCRMHDDKSCEIKQALSAQKDSVQEQQRQQLEQQRRQIAEMEEQQESLRRLQAVQALSNGVNQMFAPPVQPKKQRCRTVARPGNGLDGASAYYTTECD